MEKLERWITIIQAIILSLGALAALGLSGYNTYQIMRGAGEFMAIISVFALELSLLGLTLGVAKATNKIDNRPGLVPSLLRWVRKNSRWIPVVIIMAVIMTTNFLNRVDIIGFEMSELLYDILQLGVLGVLIPVLAVLSAHGAASTLYDLINAAVTTPEIQVAQPETVVLPTKPQKQITRITKSTKKTPKKEVFAQIRQLIENGEEVNCSEISTDSGWSRQTIQKYKDEIMAELNDDTVF